VVGVYACITSYLDSITGLEAKLLNYEKEGFQTIIHCTNQTRIYDPSNPMYSVTDMENDFITACHRMHEAGFYDWKYWAYPYGSFTNEHIRIARKTGMKCAMTVPNLEYIGFTDAVTDIRGRYTMKRMELYPTDAAGNQTLSDIKNQMDLCAKNSGLLIICTHMYQWDEQSDFTRFDEMVQYGKSKGLRFTTISEAMSYWKHLYDLYEAF
jgi:peptidoglycan/xylan/chitin deacetylase (PgdA/CDA1 family)